MNNPGYDKIHIRTLRARCILGIYPEERDKAQDIELNVTLYVDLRQAGQTDDIADTVDYKAVKRRILDLVEGSRYYLVERLAQAVADVCLESEDIHAVSVTVDKPGALRFAQSVAVEIMRSKNHGQ